MSTHTDFAQRVQSEFFSSLTAAQDLNVTSFAAFNALLAQVPTATAELPAPADLVEQTFAFTNRLLETRTAYAVKLAELATEAQQHFAHIAARVAEPAKN